MFHTHLIQNLARPVT
ncbi:hypothetical protein E2C01_089471 [Portunus trituberculatus]|uniref:Uncharacterized protein n=1 Tax=Portunus trituberculatus TaxID=210409 RepID=A0A5B7JMH4_PORTR|nr:hypothetical protein [Portunus trituberculatus]